MMKRFLMTYACVGLLVACGVPDAADPDADTDGYARETYEEPKAAPEGDIVGIATAIAEYEALQELCDYGSAQGLSMVFLTELAPTPSGDEHADAAIDATGTAATRFVGAEPEYTCTPEMFETFKGRADDALAKWEEIKAGE